MLIHNSYGLYRDYGFAVSDYNSKCDTERTYKNAIEVFKKHNLKFKYRRECLKQISWTLLCH